MKRRMILPAALLLMLLLSASAALADAWTVDTGRERFEAATFRELPREIGEALLHTPFDQDAVRCGVTVTRSRAGSTQPEQAVTLFALERGGRTLLMNGAWQPGDGWDVWIAAEESFLRPGEDFTIGVHEVRHDGDGVTLVLPAVRYGREAYAVAAAKGYSTLYAYACIDGEGSGVEIRPTYPDGDFGFIRWEKGRRAGSETYTAARSRRLEHLSAADFPRTGEELLAWQRAYPISEEGTYVFAAHLREKPTGKSRSLGQYRWAAAEVLDSAPGTQYPWYQVRIGDTVGWMSAPYVVQSPDNVNHQLAQTCEPEVICSRAELPLYNAPDGRVKGALPAGRQAQILAECDGWYHVIIPAQEGSMLASQGEYGYIRMGAAPVYASEIALAWEME